MRIITGKAKGKALETLPGEATRPTSERAKEAIFSSLQFELEGKRVLDLFAGSGQLGLEALSRGAASALFVESSPEAMAVVKKNAEATGIEDLSKFRLADFRNFLRKASPASFDILLIDPPYASNFALDAVLRAHAARVMTDGALLVLETGAPVTLPEELSRHFTVKKAARYGAAHVTVLCYHEEEVL